MQVARSPLVDRYAEIGWKKALPIIRNEKFLGPERAAELISEASNLSARMVDKKVSELSNRQPSTSKSPQKNTAAERKGYHDAVEQEVPRAWATGVLGLHWSVLKQEGCIEMLDEAYESLMAANPTEARKDLIVKARKLLPRNDA